jgi:hypothetical protein
MCRSNRIRLFAIAALIAPLLTVTACTDEAHPGADTRIDALVFADPVLAACVARDAAANEWDVSGRMTSLRCGMMATAMTMMPIPPIHWSSARHNSMACGTLCSSTRIVEPVVVTPDTASKTASTILNCIDDRMNGSALTIAITTQLSTVRSYICLGTRRKSAFRVAIARGAPTPNAINDVVRNACASAPMTAWVNRI